MKCSEALVKLEDYSYGELDLAVAATLAAHLRDCQSCTDAYQTILRENELFATYGCNVNTLPLWETLRTQIESLPSTPVKSLSKIFAEKKSFTLIEYPPLWRNIANELPMVFQSLLSDPKKFFQQLYQNDSLLTLPRQYWRVSVMSAICIWLFCGLSYLAWSALFPPEPLALGAPKDRFADIYIDYPNHFHGETLAKGGGQQSSPRQPRSSSTYAKESRSTVLMPSLPLLPTIEVYSEPQSKHTEDIPLGLNNGQNRSTTDDTGGIGTGNGTGEGNVDSNTKTSPGNGPNWSEIDVIYTPNSTGVTPPQVLAKSAASYTEEARRNAIKGVVRLLAVFRKDGTISDIQVVKGLGYGLDEEAIKAVQTIKFIPGRKDGHHVNVYGVLEYTFNIF